MEQVELFGHQSNGPITEHSQKEILLAIQNLTLWFNEEKYNIHLKKSIGEYYNYLITLRPYLTLLDKGEVNGIREPESPDTGSDIQRSS